MTRLRSIPLILTLGLMLGCSSGGQQADSGDPLCEPHAVAGESCTEDCTWAEVLAHNSYCVDCHQYFQIIDVGDCAGYHVLRLRGADFGEYRYYDLGSGALVATETFNNGTPACRSLIESCEASFQVPASWCEAYAGGAVCPDSP